MIITAALDAPDGQTCQGGDSEHKGHIRNFVVYYHDGDTFLATWCDECANHADADTDQYERVCPLIRLEEHGIGVWQALSGWWGAPLQTVDSMPDLENEWYIPHSEGWSDSELAEIEAFLGGLEALG